MKVILLENVPKVGKKYEIVDVSTGYANNFLIKNNLSMEATKGNLKKLKTIMAEIDASHEANLKNAKNQKIAIEKTTLNFKVKANNGQMFGTISSKQIVEELLKKDIKIDKKNIHIEHPINSLGNHIVKINLYNKIIANLTVVTEEG